MSTTPPRPDPRVGLAPGEMARWAKDSTKRYITKKAAEAQWNMRLVSNTLPQEPFIGVTHSDIGFIGNYAIQGNYDGYQVWDISNPRSPKLYDEYVCRGSQSDVSVYKNLIFVSGEATSGRLDCGLQRALPRHPHLRRLGSEAPEVHPERADVPRLAHALGARRSEGSREHLRLHLGLGGRSFAERAGWLLVARA
jgi:hypothetical protein